MEQRRALRPNWGPERRAQIKSRLREKFGDRCVYCRAAHPESYLEIDHVVPIIEGGTDDDFNLTQACRRCNLSKGCSTVEEWRSRRPRYLPAAMVTGCVT